MLSRREFLATAAVAAGAPVIGGAASSSAAALRFAPQTGLFERSVGCDPIAQIGRAAALGFRAFCDPQWLQRSDDERRQIVLAARNYGVLLGPATGRLPSLSGGDVPDLESAFSEAFEQTAESRGLKGLRFALGPTLLDQNPEWKWERFWRRLALAADVLDQIVLVEPWDDGREGARLFERWAALVRRVDLPGLRLVVDGHQLRQAGILITDYVQRHRDVIGHVELPRLTPRNVPEIARVLRTLSQGGYQGVIGLRQGLIGSVAEAEAELVAMCRELPSLRGLPSSLESSL